LPDITVGAEEKYHGVAVALKTRDWAARK
jgi:hypothetical protein